MYHLKYCQNCSRRGHGFKSCSKPIVSFGLLAFRRGAPGEPLRFLLIQRKDSIGYLDFIRGRYMDSASDSKTHTLQNIKILIEEMTPDEIDRLSRLPFRELWDALWINHHCRAYITDYPEAESKFEALDIPNLLSQVTPRWHQQEFGIPKGRRNGHETDLECACREFEEETGLTSRDYIVRRDGQMQEIFVGSNGKPYRHVYFLAELLPHATIRIDHTNVTQVSEIRGIGLFTLEEAIRQLREYDMTKRSLLVQAHDALTTSLKNHGGGYFRQRICDTLPVP